MAQKAPTWLVVTAFVLLNVLGLALWIWNTYQEDRIARTRAAVPSVSPAAGKGDLRIDAWTGSSRVTTNDTLTFSITIQNPQKTPITDLDFVTFDPNVGFEPSRSGSDAGCWTDAGKPVCIALDPHRVMPVQWPRSLAPGDAVTVMARVKAKDESGQWTLNAVVMWRNRVPSADGKGTEPGALLRKPISLGPVMVESRGKFWTYLALKSTQSYVKDLTLPIALALLGFWLKKQEEKREKDRKSDDERRDKERQEREQNARKEREAEQEYRARLHSVWTMMLPKTHANNEAYYMPISDAAGKVSDYAGKVARDGAMAVDQCFFYFWRLHKQVIDFGSAIGGWYLKDRYAEDVVALAWVAIMEWTDDTIGTMNATNGRELREEVVEALGRSREPRMRFFTFQRQLAWQQPFALLRPQFDVVIQQQSFEVILAVIDLFVLVLDFEMNRAYEYWYGQEQMPSLDIREYDSIFDRFRVKRAALVAPAYAKALDRFEEAAATYRRRV